MTSTVSFKDKLKQIFSVILWDLKGCKASLMVYTILASVFTVIIFTLVFVLTADQTSFSPLFSTESSPKISLSEKMQVFQVISSAIIGFLTLIFAIIYTVQIFSYMHNKRKVDFYGSLPISRARLFLAKYGAAYLFSIIPMLVFMGIIAIASVCTGTLLLPQVTNMYVNFIVGTLACISAYGFLSACCGTTFNTVIMFIAVCACYPLSMVFVRAYIDAFFTGSYTGNFSDSFITNALNPISAYFGNNLIYWIIFSVVCIALGTLLIMKRRSERAQTSFAYYIPCHIIKVIVSFLAGMFLGTMFGAINVFGNGVGGFVFGFILASAPTFLIVHMIFYKGLKQIVRTIPIYAGLAVVVIVGVVLINLDVFGYNTYVPKSEDVKSAGLICSEYSTVGKNISKYYTKSAGDFTDEADIKSIINVHNEILTKKKTNTTSKAKFSSVWGSMLYNTLREYASDEIITVAYKLNSGRTVTRYYSKNLLEMAATFDYEPIDYTDDTYDVDYGYSSSGFTQIYTAAKPVLSSKPYIMKYSGVANAGLNEDFQVSSVTVHALTKTYSEDSVYSSTIENYGEYSYDEKEKDPKEIAEKNSIMNDINAAFKKDLEADTAYLNGVLYDPFALLYNDDIFYDSSNDEDSVYSFDSLKYIREKYSKDYVCKIQLTYTNYDPEKAKKFIFGTNSTEEYEYYFVPKSYTNTIEVLKKYGLLKADYTLNKNSEYFNVPEYGDYDTVYER